MSIFDSPQTEAARLFILGSLHGKRFNGIGISIRCGKSSKESIETFGTSEEVGASKMQGLSDSDGNGKEAIGGFERASLFPPEKEDADAKWPPGFEPAVCRVAHGLPNRVDRIRALGNGVVPMVAAYAWRTLKDAFDK
jgi:hypothetical protein